MTFSKYDFMHNLSLYFDIFSWRPLRRYSKLNSDVWGPIRIFEGQYGYLRANTDIRKVNVKYVITIFHTVPDINPRLITTLQLRCRAWYRSLGLISGPIWKMSCNNLLLSHILLQCDFIPIFWNVLIWLKYDFMHNLSLYFDIFSWRPLRRYSKLNSDVWGPIRIFEGQSF
jgi:hypothetical protein